MIRGGSAIVDPLGRVLAGPDFTGETILYAEIDLDQIARGKFDPVTIKENAVYVDR